MTINNLVMNKIVIEVTSDGWETTVTINGKEYKEKHVATRDNNRLTHYRKY